VRILLDSHVALWWLEDNVGLGPQSRQLIVDEDEVFFSAITPWELGIKLALGKLTMPDGMSAALEAAGFLQLPITAAHAERAPTLPPHHRD
jgi:PIN domain nuclease of toxin-antitoxin system